MKLQATLIIDIYVEQKLNKQKNILVCRIVYDILAQSSLINVTFVEIYD